MDTKTTRRDILRIGGTAAAIAGASTALGGGVAIATEPETIAQSARSEWDLEMRDYRRALAEDHAINAQHTQADANGAMTEALESEWDASGTRLSIAEWAVFETPAPDLAALGWKLTMLSTRGLVFEDDFAATILADVRRLAAQEGR